MKYLTTDNAEWQEPVWRPALPVEPRSGAAALPRLHRLLALPPPHTLVMASGMIFHSAWLALICKTEQLKLQNVYKYK